MGILLREDRQQKATKGEERMEVQVQQYRKQSEAENETQEGLTGQALYRLIESQGYRCGLSGVEISPKHSSLDHKTPVVDGGEHVISNVEWVHPVINRMKGTMTREEFIRWCNRVSNWTS